jgi:hypothetical protein
MRSSAILAMGPLQGTGMELAANVLLAPKCYQQERVHRVFTSQSILPHDTLQPFSPSDHLNQNLAQP